MKQRLDQLIDQAEQIGVIGSPSSTSELALDILANAMNKKLVGELAILRYIQEGTPHYALGQITEVQLRNVWHEDPTMRSLIRQRGKVDTVSERQDTHLGEMTISAVFSAKGGSYRPSILGTVPSTGTPIHLVTNEVLQELLAPFQQQIFYLGHIYGSTPLLPCWFKHFGSGSDGAGEAYHLGIFGKTGSGKSVLAKMILLAYARHPEMGLLVIDPQGEFAKEMRGEPVPGAFQLPFKDILAKLRKSSQVYGIKDLVLDRWELFAQILYESPFFEQLSIPKGENRRLAAETLVDQLKRKSVTLKDLYKEDAFNKAWEILGNETVQKMFYRADSARERFKSMYKEADSSYFFKSFWQPIARLFSEERGKDKAQKVEMMLQSLFQSTPKPIMIIDLSIDQERTASPSIDALPLFSGDAVSQQDGNALFWNETIQSLVIKRLLEGIRIAAERAYRQGQGLNTLVLIDEAHRIAPREEPSDDEQKAVRSILIDAARTTRKYGVGWMFISQTLSSLHREIVEQLRIFFFGFGLSMGAEFRALSELVSGRSKALDLYQLFRDPHSSVDPTSREYSFMTIGPVSPLSFAGTPLFFNAFNRVEEFLQSNKLT